MTTTPARTIRTTLHSYRFDLRSSKEAAAWQTLKATLSGHPRCMESHGGLMHLSAAGTLGAKYINSPEFYASIEVDLDTAFLSDNQWNATASGKTVRVFDWALDYNPNENPKIKQGHWLEQTEEMRAIRRDTHVCGYCGHKEDHTTAGAFCKKCLTTGSEYLKPSDLFLLRMRPAGTAFGTDRAPLTAVETAELMPLYIAAQLNTHDHGKAAAETAKGIEQAATAAKRAAVLRAGWEFIEANKITTRNLICYDPRTGREAAFTWGWIGDGMPAVVAEELARRLADMPAPWEIILTAGSMMYGVEGAKLSGGGGGVTTLNRIPQQGDTVRCRPSVWPSHRIGYRIPVGG